MGKGAVSDKQGALVSFRSAGGIGKAFEKALSAFLSVVLVVGLWPHAAYAADGLTAVSSSVLPWADVTTQADSQSPTAIEITANGTDTIKVEASQTGDQGEPSESSGTTLSLKADKQKIERDYSQIIEVKVRNDSELSKQYYLTSDNTYDDLYMNFVEGGSIGAPLTIQAGETQTVNLSVFAQNAERTSYTVRVMAYVVDGADSVGDSDTNVNLDTSMYVTFDCEAANGRISLSKGQMSETTLAVDYTVTNTGNKKITDVTASLSGDAADYARITPSIENYELGVGRSIAFQVVPDLSKMKANEQTKVTGMLNIIGGATARSSLTFDTQGKEITSTTMGELGLIQGGNKYAGMTFDEDSLSITTNARGNTQNFSDITKQYYVEGDSEKDGVNTVEEYGDVVKTLIADDGSIDFTMENDVIYDDGQRAKMSISVSSEIVKAGVLQGQNIQTQDDTADDLTCTMTVDAKGNVVTTTEFSMPWDEYVEKIEAINSYVGDLNIEGIDNLVVDGGTVALKTFGVETDASDVTKVSMKIVDKLESGLLGFPTDFSFPTDFGQKSLDTWMYEKYLREASSNYYKFTESSLMQTSRYAKYAKGVGTVTKVVSTGIDAYKTIRIWNNPKATTGQKWGYSALQTAKAANRFWGGKLLAKGGAALGTAVADGPGAVVGFFGGLVLSGILDWGLGKWADSVEEAANAEDGMAMYYDVYGHQCTNAGRVSSDFYIPDYVSRSGDVNVWGDDVELMLPDDSQDPDGDSGIQIRETGRMYDGTDGDNYYVDATKVGYKYLINGHEVSGAMSTNNGLTQVTMVDLTGGVEYLVPGNNTIVRDYDTNPGTHYVTADSEITVIYPLDENVSYIGDPDEMEEVRRLPDFAVYRENISLEGEAIKGETSKAKVYVYNRGSLGGWVTIDVTDGANSLVHEEDVYMEAFSEKAIEFDWTPTEAGPSSIGVKLTNRSLITEERKMTNNAAAHTFAVREREIPEISAISPTTAFLTAGEGFYVSADLDKTADIDANSVSLSLDGNALGGVSFVRMGDSRARASAWVEGLAAGKHTIDVAAAYATALGTGIVKRSQELDVTGRTTIDVKTDSTIANPVFYAIDKEDGTAQRLSAQRGEELSGTTSYTLTKAADMEGGELSSYLLMVRADGGFLFVDMADSDKGALTLSEGHKLTVSGSELMSRFGIGVDGCQLPGGMYVDAYCLGMFEASEIMIGGAERVDVDVRYDVASSVRWAYRSGIDVTKDETIDLSTEVRTYTLDTSAIAVQDDDSDGESPYFPYYYVTLLVDGKTVYCDCHRLEDLTTYTLVVIGQESISKLDESHEIVAYLCDYDNSRMYRAVLDNSGRPIVVTDAGNCDVMFSVNSGDGDEAEFNEVSTSFMIGDRSFRLYGSTINVPAGTYDLSLNYTVNGTRYFASKTVVASGARTQVELEFEEQPKAKLKITWPDSLGYSQDASVGSYYFSENGGQDYSFSAPNGQAIEVPVGECSVSVTLHASSRRGGSVEEDDDGYYGDYDYKSVSFYKQMTFTEGRESVFDISAVFTGSAECSSDSPVRPGSHAYLELGQLSDGNGCALSHLEANDNEPLMGEVIFTDVSNSARKFASTFTLSWLYAYDDLSIPIPENIEPGEYSYTVHLATGGSADGAVFYKIATNVEGNGTVSPASPSVQKGANQNLKFTPDEGYLVQDVVVDGESLGGVDSYAFENVVDDHAVSVRFIPESAVVKGVSLDPNSLELEKGASASLTPSIVPDGAADKTVMWSSGDKRVASVDANGIVTATGVGTTVVSVTTHDGGFKASCYVKVYQKEELSAGNFSNYFDVTSKLDAKVGDDVTGTVAVAPKEVATSLPASAVTVTYYAVDEDESGNETLIPVEASAFAKAGVYVAKAKVSGNDPKLTLNNDEIVIARFKVGDESAVAPTIVVDTSSLYEETAQEALARVMDFSADTELRVESFSPLSLDTLRQPGNSALNQELARDLMALDDAQDIEIVIAPRFSPIVSTYSWKAAEAKAKDAMNLRGDRSTMVEGGVFMLDISMLPSIVTASEGQVKNSKALRSRMGDTGAPMVFSVPLSDAIVSLLNAGAIQPETPTVTHSDGSKTVMKTTRYLRVYCMHDDGADLPANLVGEYKVADLVNGKSVRLSSRYFSTFVFALEDTIASEEVAASDSPAKPTGGTGSSGSYSGSRGGSSIGGSTSPTVTGKLVSIAELQPISVVNGSSFADIKSQLAKQADLTVSSGGITKTASAPIAWGSDPSYDQGSKAAQSITFTGTVTLPAGVYNSDAIPLTVTQVVNVGAAPSEGSQEPGSADGTGGSGGTDGSSGSASDAAITSVTLLNDSLTYNGKVRRALVKTVFAGSQVVPGSACDVHSEGGREVGTYTVTVTAKPGSGFTGTATATFTIKQAKSRVIVKPKMKAKRVSNRSIVILRVLSPAAKKNISISVQPTKKSLRKSLKLSSNKKAVKLLWGAKKGVYKIRVSVKGGSGNTYTNITPKVYKVRVR